MCLHGTQADELVFCRCHKLRSQKHSTRLHSAYVVHVLLAEQTDEHGLVKHVDQLCAMAYWYPPCDECMDKESAKASPHDITSSPNLWRVYELMWAFPVARPLGPRQKLIQSLRSFHICTGLSTQRPAVR